MVQLRIAALLAAAGSIVMRCCPRCSDKNLASSPTAALPRALPAVKCGHDRLERDVHDPAE